VEKELDTSLSEIYISLGEQFESYLGDHYCGYWMYRVAEMLDPRTYKLKVMNIEDKQSAIKEIQNLCTLHERTSEKERSLLSNSHLAHDVVAIAVLHLLRPAQ
jgi:hypothetical protein